MDNYSVENIFNKICSLDKESINIYANIELMINRLSIDELKELLTMIDNKIKNSDPYNPSIILRTFYGSVFGRIYIMEKNDNVSKLK